MGNAVFKELLVAHLLAKVLHADLLGLGAVRIRAGRQHEGLPGPQLAQEPALGHVWQGHAQVNAAGLANGAVLALHPQRDLLLCDVLEARDVILVLQQRQRTRGLVVPLFPLELVPGLAAPLAVLGCQLQSLPEASQRVVHQEHCLRGPQGSAVVGVKLPVYLGMFVLWLRQLLPIVVEDREGAVLVEVELLAVQGVDVGVPDDAARKFAGADSADTASATKVHYQRGHALGEERDDRRVAVLTRAGGGSDVGDQAARAVELNERRLFEVPKLNVKEFLWLLELELDLRAWFLAAVVHLGFLQVHQVVLGPDHDPAISAPLQILVDAGELLCTGVQDPEWPRARLLTGLRLCGTTSARDLDALESVLRDLVAVVEAVKVQFARLSFAEALLVIVIIGLDKESQLGCRTRSLPTSALSPALQKLLCRRAR